jgi:DNA-binding NtrC family response regulator
MATKPIETISVQYAGQSSLHPRSRATQPEVERQTAKRILLVSADSNLRRLLRSFLEHAGFDVVCCADVDQGTLACAKGPGPDLLLVDLDSLGEPAREMALSMAARRAGLLVVALHGDDSGPELCRSAQKRGWKLVLKPFLVPHLLGVICSALDSERNRIAATVPK